MNSLSQNTQENTGHPRDAFLSTIFSHEKCRLFSDEEKKKVRTALIGARWAHRHQKRSSGEPYINHIERTLLAYLEITQKNVVTVDDILVAMLHDVLEDHPQYGKKIEDTFGREIYVRVASISKPESDTIVEHFSALTHNILLNEGNLYSKANYVASKFFHLQISPKIYISHLQVFQRLEELYPSMQNNLRNYYFFWRIALLDENDFEIKSADRVDNLGDLQGVDREYVEKNLISTEIYILKARAFGRNDLVQRLENGRQHLIRRKDELTNG